MHVRQWAGSNAEKHGISTPKDINELVDTGESGNESNNNHYISFPKDVRWVHLRVCGKLLGLILRWFTGNGKNLQRSILRRMQFKMSTKFSIPNIHINLLQTPMKVLNYTKRQLNTKKSEWLGVICLDSFSLNNNQCLCFALIQYVGRQWGRENRKKWPLNHQASFSTDN